MESSNVDWITPALFAFTFLAVLLFGLRQFFKVRKAQREHRHSISQMQEEGRAPAHYGGPPRDR